MAETIVGIDLGTTNSAVALVRGGTPELLNAGGQGLLPSVLGFNPEGDLLVGHEARNQARLHPERTIRSAKRLMGQAIELSAGDEHFTPVEASALVLHRLKLLAERALQGPVNRAVITVPAYFSDAQRTATREAGEIAGFQVERILNEPTAAALCYLGSEQREQIFLVYDLGGGTFDVSIVRASDRVTEVLASHGDAQLGGDDFDECLARWLCARFKDSHGVDPAERPRSFARLLFAAEEAKIKLSERAEVRVNEAHLLTHGGVPLHMEEEITRGAFEGLIEPLLQRTKDSIQVALTDAGLVADDLDDIILVGGSTRIPRVREMLQELLGLKPRMEVDPDRAVALGAALQAARIGGDHSQRILVDVCPYSFGTSYFGDLLGFQSPFCYRPIIPRNTPLPSRRTKTFFTMHDGQEAVDASIYHGENDDARLNTLLGRFMVDGLDPDALSGSAIVYDISLDLDGLLHVEVREQSSGRRRSVTIKDAFRKLSSEELVAARRRLVALVGELSAEWGFAHPIDDGEDSEPLGGGAAAGASTPPPSDLDEAGSALWLKANELMGKADSLGPSLSELDAEEVQEYIQRLRGAMDLRQIDLLQSTCDEFSDVLFYLE